LLNAPGKRPECGAGQTTEKSERGQRLAIDRPGQLAERREGSIVGCGGQRHPGEQPATEQQRRLARECHQGECRCTDECAHSHHPPPAVAVNRATDMRRCHPGDHQRSGEGAEHQAARQPQVFGHRSRKHCDGIVKAAPSGDLTQTEHYYYAHQQRAWHGRGIGVHAQQTCAVASSGLFAGAQHALIPVLAAIRSRRSTVQQVPFAAPTSSVEQMSVPAAPSSLRLQLPPTAYSTVTLFARFLGLSTSVPFTSAA
jgi:hypothetical protein